MLRGGAATASVRVVPGDGEHAAAMPAPHLLRLALERGTVAACRADGVLRAPAHRHVDRVTGAGHDGPALRPDGNDLDGVPRDADGALADLDDRRLVGHPHDLVPRPAPRAVVHLAAHAGPLRDIRHSGLSSARTPLPYLGNDRRHVNNNRGYQPRGARGAPLRLL